MTPELVGKLTQFVQAGGILITTFRSGVKDWNNAVTEKTLPGELSELMGIEIEEYDSIYGDAPIGITMELEGQELEGNACTWSDVIVPRTAQVLAKYSTEYYAGKAAVTQNAFDKGEAIYVGTRLDADLTSRLIDYVLVKAGVAHGALAETGIETAIREKDGMRLLFLLNHEPNTQTAVLPNDYVDVLTETPMTGKIELEPYEVTVLREA